MDIESGNAAGRGQLERAVVVVEPDAGFSAAEFVEWWAADGEASQLGTASVQSGRTSTFGPEIVEWVAIPLAVNLASNALYDLVKRLVARVRSGKTGMPGESGVEVVQTVTPAGDPVVIVRSVPGSDG
jgi:hypothetical protein